VESSAPMPPNKPEVETPVSNDSLISECCRFALVIHYMPPLEGFDADVDIGVELVDDSPSDVLRQRFVLCADGVLWH